jgi:hypothetical protein
MLGNYPTGAATIMGTPPMIVVIGEWTNADGLVIRYGPHSAEPWDNVDRSMDGRSRLFYDTPSRFYRI